MFLMSRSQRLTSSRSLMFLLIGQTQLTSWYNRLPLVAFVSLQPVTRQSRSRQRCWLHSVVCELKKISKKEEFVFWWVDWDSFNDMPYASCLILTLITILYCSEEQNHKVTNLLLSLSLHEWVSWFGHTLYWSVIMSFVKWIGTELDSNVTIILLNRSKRLLLSWSSRHRIMSTRSEKERTKQIHDKCQRLLNEMLKDDDNKYCVDCDAKGI